MRDRRLDRGRGDHCQHLVDVSHAAMSGPQHTLRKMYGPDGFALLRGPAPCQPPVA